MEVKPKRQRKSGTKYSKTACRTCKIRRVKCDEGRPDCRNCVSTGRTCDGYHSGVPSREMASQRPLLPASASPPTIVTISRLPSSSTFSTTLEDHNSFQFFIQHIVAGLKLISPTHEWITLSLQLAVTEPAVYFAIAACGSVANIRLAKNYHCYFAPPSPVKQKINLRQYCKATAALQKYIDRAASGQASIEPVLLCCLLFVSYETYQDETGLAMQHLKLGRRTIEDSIAGRLEFSSKQTSKDVIAAFDWMGSQSTNRGRKELSSGDVLQDKPSNGISTYFTSLEHAKQALDRLSTTASDWRTDLLALATEYIATTDSWNTRPAIRECIIYCVSRSMHLIPGHHLLCREAELIQVHTSWLRGLKLLQQDSTLRRDLIHMQIQHFYSTFTLQTARDTYGKSIDRFDAQAAAILDLVEEYLRPDTTYPRRPTSPSQKGSNAQLYPYTPLPQQQEYCFALEYAILPTLFSICLRIRHSATRKRALHLLRTANRREAGQSSAELCHYADAFIALEESSPSDAAGEVAEEARLLEVVIESAG
ncbi:hypothetical protein D6D02_03043 [Aureobasidium pullulans]|nr:hypothetical protein D6D00_09190 [Aureobasidium pullulans]THY17792.1 hypothetical protein D6D02_03043 [Aureobasidium pullulans]